MRAEKTNNLGKIWLKTKMQPYRASIFFLTCLTIIAAVISLAFAYLVRYVINSATKGQNKTLWILSSVLVGLLLFKILLKIIDSFWAEKLRAKITTQLRVDVFSQILRSEYAQITKYHSGELLNRLTADIAEVTIDTVGFVPTLAGMFVQCVGSIVALCTIDWRFTIFYAVCGIAFGGIAAVFRKQLKKYHKAVLQADGEHKAFMQEGLTSLITLKAYSAEERTTKASSRLANQYYKQRMKRNSLRVGMNAVVQALSNAGLIFAVVWGGISIIQGTTDYGSVLSVILLLMQFQQPLTSFSSVIPVYYARLASGERLAELEYLDKEPIYKQTAEYFSFSTISSSNLSFSYDRDCIFNNAEFTLSKGKIVCLTGTSGAGKSTIFKLLLQVYKPTSGIIYIKDSQDALTPLTEAHRGLFAYVPQGNFLFSGTIYENLTSFCNAEQATLDHIKEALRVACAEFVFELPEGLQTKLAERGGGLSEGQLQRLAVARAILSSRPILLLDEATSALDGDTEVRLLDNIKKLTDKTCLIVTHRTAALAIADETWAVEGGQIIRQ